MRYKILSCISVAAVFCLAASAAYATTETTINADVPIDEINITENIEVNEDELGNIDENAAPVESIEATESNILSVDDEMLSLETVGSADVDYTEYLLTIIDLLNLSCACFIAATIVVVIAIISMRWI